MFETVGNDIRKGAVTITGLNDLGRRLSIFSERITNEITKAAIKEGALVFKAKAIDNIDLNNHNIKQHRLKVKGVYITINPGNLKKNIFIKKVKGMPKGTVRMEVFLRKRTAWYGTFVERGTSKMAATPFMASAFESKREEVVQVFKERIRRAIREGGI